MGNALLRGATGFYEQGFTVYAKSALWGVYPIPALLGLLPFNSLLDRETVRNRSRWLRRTGVKNPIMSNSSCS